MKRKSKPLNDGVSPSNNPGVLDLFGCPSAAPKIMTCYKRRIFVISSGISLILVFFITVELGLACMGCKDKGFRKCSGRMDESSLNADKMESIHTSSDAVTPAYDKWKEEGIVEKYLLALIKVQNVYPKYSWYSWESLPLGWADILMRLERVDRETVNIDIEVVEGKEKIREDAYLSWHTENMPQEILHTEHVNPLLKNGYLHTRVSLNLPRDVDLQTEIHYGEQTWTTPSFSMPKEPRWGPSNEKLRKQTKNPAMLKWLRILDESGCEGGEVMENLLGIDIKLYETLRMIHQSPMPSGLDFNGVNLIRAVNHLHKAGKEKAIEALMLYDDICVKEDELSLDETLSYYDDQRIPFILRLLFVPRDAGLEMPLMIFGGGNIDIPDEDTSFPDFPLVLVENFPLMLVSGYAVGGMIGPCDDEIEFCRTNCRLREQPLAPKLSPVTALDKLVTNERWTKLFRYKENHSDEKSTIQMLRNQISYALQDVYQKTFDAFEGEKTGGQCVSPEVSDLFWPEYRKIIEEFHPVWDAEKQSFVSSKLIN